MGMSRLSMLLKSYVVGYRRAMAGLEDVVRANTPNFSRLVPDAQQEARTQALVALREKYKTIMQAFVEDAEGKVRGAQAELNRVRNPLLASSLSADRSAGELQVNSAFHFLEGKPAPEAIAETVRKAFDMGRTEFAVAVIDGVRANTPRDLRGNLLPQDERQQTLLNELEKIERAWEKFPEMEKRKRAVENLEPFVAMGKTFLEQIEQGFPDIHLPELWLYLKPEEEGEYLSYKVPHLTQQALLKRRLNEVQRRGKVVTN